uniref:Uncharacterized protein n=1 Tax=Pan paniscus TaxID=9597 RepID=A0A2R8Z727_PANPA
MPEAHMQPANLQTSLPTTDHGSKKAVSCYLPPLSNAHPMCIEVQNAQNCSAAAATLEPSIISDTCFYKPITKDQLSSRSELNTVRLKCLNSLRGWKILNQLSLT